jgi:acetyl esterase/lipase
MKRILIGAAALLLFIHAHSLSAQQTRQLTVDATVGELLDNPASRAVLARQVPVLVSSPQIDQARGLSLRSLQAYAPTVLTDARLKAIDEELARTPGTIASATPPSLSASKPPDTHAALRLISVRLWESRAPHATGDAPYDVPSLTVVTTDGARSFGTAVIVAPGGGYLSLATGHEGRQIADWFSANGVTAFVLTYRLGSAGYKHPVQLEDAQRAIRWVRSHAEQYGVARDRIGMIGFSAGGHLTAMASTRFDTGDPTAADPVDRESSRPDFAILVYASTVWGEHGWSPAAIVGPNPSASVRDELSPAKHVSPQTPATLILHTDTDDVVPAESAVMYYASLRAAKVPVELHIFERGIHGFGFGMSDPALGVIPTLVQNWLRGRRLIGIE